MSNIILNTINNEENNQYDIVIIGAGVAGLTAAYTLKKTDPNLRILILEAKNRIGGRVETTKLKCSKNGDKSEWDLGAQWVSAYQGAILPLIKELNLELYDQFEDGLWLRETNGKIYTNLDGDDVKFGFLSDKDYNMRFNQMNSDAMKLNKLDPYITKEHAEYLDMYSCKHLYVDRCYTKDAKSLMTVVFRSIFGLEPSQVNALNIAYNIKSSKDLEAMCGVGKNSMLQYKIKGGAQKICEGLMQFVLTDSTTAKLLLEAPVLRISQNDNEASVTVYNKKIKREENFSCKKIISSIPLNQYSKIEFHPILPAYKRHLFDTCKCAYLTKYVVTYDKPFKTPIVLMECDGSTYKSKNDSKNLPSVAPFELVIDSTNELNNAALVAIASANSAYQWADVDYEIRKQEVLSYLEHLVGPEAADYTDFVEKLWVNEPYTGGCPAVQVSALGVMKDFVRATREPFMNVHFCGTESALNWQGFMDGAAESGIRVANEIAYCLSKTNSKIKFDFFKTYYYQKTEIERLKIENDEKKKKTNFKIVLKFSTFIAFTAFILFKLNKHLIQKNF